MGYTTSTVHGIEVPDSAEANNVPEDIGKVVTALEAGSIVKRLTSAQIAALTAPQKPAGLVVYNTTTGKLMVSDGTNVNNVDAAVYAIGVRTTGVQSIAAAPISATVTCTSETDPYSMLSSGGVATVPTAGLWMLTGSVSYDGDGIGTLSFRQNLTTDIAVVNNHYAGAGGGLYGGIALSTIVVCAASDTLEMRVQNGSATSFDIRNARFTVHRIGS